MKEIISIVLIVMVLNIMLFSVLPMSSCVSGNDGKPSVTIDPDLQAELDYWRDQALSILRQWIANITIEDIVNGVLRIINSTKISTSAIDTGSSLTSASIRQAVDTYIKSLTLILQNEDIDTITKAVEAYLIAQGSTTRYGYPAAN